MRVVALIAFLIPYYANADLLSSLKSGDFQAANDSSLRDHRSAVREAQILISKFERVHKNINFQSNELVCKPDQSDSFHHVCLGFTLERELVSGKFWQDTVSRIAPELLKVDEEATAHYKALIKEKSEALAQKVKAEVEGKLAECKSGKTIEEMQTEKACIQSVGKNYVGGVFTNSLYQKHVVAGPVYAVLSPRLEGVESKLKEAIAKWQASPEGQIEEAAFNLCNAYASKNINQRAIEDEKEIGRTTGFVDAKHLYRSGSFLSDAKKIIASYEPKFKKLKGRKFEMSKDCGQFEKANTEE